MKKRLLGVLLALTISASNLSGKTNIEKLIQKGQIHLKKISGRVLGIKECSIPVYSRGSWSECYSIKI